MKNNLSNYSEQLIVKLKSLVTAERKITAEIIELTREIDQKRIYLQYGHTSMFAMLTKDFGYTPASAMRRIDAARLSKEVPEIQESLKTGKLNLSQVSMVAQAVRQKEKEAKTASETKVDSTVSKETKASLLNQVKSMDLVATQKTLASSLDLEVQTFEKKTYQKDESVYMNITLSKELQKDLERVKELISHQNSNPTMAELIQFLATHFLDKKDPLRSKRKLDKVHKPKQETNKQNSDCIASDCSAPVPASRQSHDENRREAVPLKTRKEIFKRDQSCQWTTQTKNLKGQIQKTKCGSRFQLQVDHIKPKWQDGDNNVQNLQLLCATHNKLKYQLEVQGKT